MPAEGFNFQGIIRRLGLKNIDELPIVRAITPVLQVGDGSNLVNPLRGAEAWFGQELAPVVGENAAFQIRALTRDLVCTIYFGSDAGFFVHFRIDDTGGDILSADPLVPFPIVANQNVGPIPTTSLLFGGTTTVAPGILTPALPCQTGVGRVDDLFIPIGHVLTFSHDDFNSLFVYSIHWKEFVAPDLIPREE